MIIVYTAIIAGFDALKPVPQACRRQAHFVAFADCPIEKDGGGWEIRAPVHTALDSRRSARYHKILAHRLFPEATFTLWLDGSVFLKPDLQISKLISSFLECCDLAVHPHRVRKCVYDEGVACILQKKDSIATIFRQMRAYRAEGYPINGGLAETMVLLRRNTPKVADFCETWFGEVLAYSVRDQLSFNYVAYKTGMNFAFFPEAIDRSRNFLWTTHRLNQ